jgi:hypothetical protein
VNWFELFLLHPRHKEYLKALQLSDSSVGIATGYWLEGPGSNPCREEIFRTRPDRPWGPPIQWLPGLSRGVKRPDRGVDQPHPSSAEVK